MECLLLTQEKARLRTHLLSVYSANTSLSPFLACPGISSSSVPYRAAVRAFLRSCSRFFQTSSDGAHRLPGSAVPCVVFQEGANGSHIATAATASVAIMEWLSTSLQGLEQPPQ